MIRPNGKISLMRLSKKTLLPKHLMTPKRMVVAFPFFADQTDNQGPPGVELFEIAVATLFAFVVALSIVIVGMQKRSWQPKYYNCYFRFI
jgi:hypothetical protein